MPEPGNESNSFQGTPSCMATERSSGFCTSTEVLGRLSSQPRRGLAIQRTNRAFTVSDVNIKPSPANALSRALAVQVRLSNQPPSGPVRHDERDRAKLAIQAPRFHDRSKKRNGFMLRAPLDRMQVETFAYDLLRAIAYPCRDMHLIAGVFSRTCMADDARRNTSLPNKVENFLGHQSPAAPRFDSNCAPIG